MDTDNTNNHRNIIDGTTRNGRRTHVRGTAMPRFAPHARSLCHARNGRKAHTDLWHAPPPAVIDLDMIPGRLTMAQLIADGIITPLDERNGYLTALEHSTEGRARVAEAMLPHDTMACMGLARWVWVGGTFPTTIDLISDAHFRACRHGRRIRAYKRRIAPEHRATIGALTLTSPTRTACDLGCHGASGKDADSEWRTHLRRILERWNVRPDDCLKLVGPNQRWPGRREGMALFAEMAEEWRRGSGGTGGTEAGGTGDTSGAGGGADGTGLHTGLRDTGLRNPCRRGTGQRGANPCGAVPRHNGACGNGGVGGGTRGTADADATSTGTCANARCHHA